jgi:hypothetical protein
VPVESGAIKREASEESSDGSEVDDEELARLEVSRFVVLDEKNVEDIYSNSSQK